MRKILLFVLLITFLLPSCGVYQKALIDGNNNVAKVELGMTKSEVLSLMGDAYRFSGLKKNEAGNLVEYIWYPATANSIYFFTFKDAKLIEWKERFLYKEGLNISDE